MFKFTAPTIPNNVFVIGAGGTGSRLVPLLAQFLRTITRGVSPSGWIESPNIWVIDDDTVEEKNLMRQNFIRQDINKNKAVVVAERYSRAFDVNIYPITKRITAGVNRTSGYNALLNDVSEFLQAKHNVAPDEAKRLGQYCIGNSIVIICVDSAKARRDILNTFVVNSGLDNLDPTRIFFIDAGNEDSYGQVSYFNPKVYYGKENYLIRSKEERYEIPKLHPHSINVDYWPMDLEYYLTLQDTKSTASCADLNQTLAINALMATNIMGIVQNYYYRKPMNYNCVRVDLNGGNAVDFNTFTNLKSRTINKSKYQEITSSYDTYKADDGTHMFFLAHTSWLDIMGSGQFYTLLWNEVEKDKLVREGERVAAERARLAKIRIEKETADLEAAKLLSQKAVAEPEEESQVAIVADALVPIQSLNGDMPHLVAEYRQRRPRRTTELPFPASEMIVAPAMRDFPVDMVINTVSDNVTVPSLTSVLRPLELVVDSSYEDPEITADVEDDIL